MKKQLSMILVLLLCLSFGTSLAEGDLGIQVIGEENPAGAVSLDDLQISGIAEIPGYADVTITNFEFVDSFLSVVKGLDISKYNNTFWYTENKDGWVNETDSYHHIQYQDKWWSENQVVLNESKTQADFAMLRVDILNKSGGTTDFIEKVEVIVVFDDNAKFNGWVRQYDFDVSEDKPLNTADNFSIDPYYIGHYVFGCTLPNTVVNSKDPLRMEIKLGENELTYYIRK